MAGLAVVEWSASSRDWNSESHLDQIVRIATQGKLRGVLIFHDASGDFNSTAHGRLGAYCRLQARPPGPFTLRIRTTTWLAAPTDTARSIPKFQTKGASNRRSLAAALRDRVLPIEDDPYLLSRAAAVLTFPRGCGLGRLQRDIPAVENTCE